MAQPDVGGFADAIYEQMAPLTFEDEDLGWPLLYYLDGVGTMLEELDDFAHADTPWSAMIDIDVVPDKGLPFLAQFVGVDLDTTLSPDEQRQQIRAHSGWQRGTPAAFKAAAAARLTGSQRVDLFERDTSAYHFRVMTYSTETPVEDWPATNLCTNPSFESDTLGWGITL
jgi:Phage tail protein (Tail_P2_I)